MALPSTTGVSPFWFTMPVFSIPTWLSASGSLLSPTPPPLVEVSVGVASGVASVAGVARAAVLVRGVALVAGTGVRTDACGLRPVLPITFPLLAICLAGAGATISDFARPCTYS